MAGGHFRKVKQCLSFSHLYIVMKRAELTFKPRVASSNKDPPASKVEISGTAYRKKFDRNIAIPSHLTEPHRATRSSKVLGTFQCNSLQTYSMSGRLDIVPLVRVGVVSALFVFKALMFLIQMNRIVRRFTRIRLPKFGRVCCLMLTCWWQQRHDKR